MIILHLIETGGPGGAEQMLLRLADEYRRRGFAQVVCLRKEGWLAQEIRRRGFPLEIRDLKRLPDFGWLCFIRGLARKYRVTAIHAHEFAMNARAGILAKWLGIPAVATVHGKSYYSERWIRRLTYRIVSRFISMVAVSKDIRDLLISKVRISPSRVDLILNGIDTELFSFSAEKRSSMRDWLGINGDELLLGTVGSYYSVKGHRFLIDAMQKLVAIDRNLKLVMAGQGPLAAELRRQICDRELGASVQIVNYIEDTQGLLSALDFFVMPSLSEGLPLSLLEAAANGRCIVATNVGGIPEVITHQGNGILVPPGSSDALADAIAGLVANPETRSSLGYNAALAAQRDWSIQGTADRYLELLSPT